MALSNFTPSGYGAMSVQSTTANQAVPGGGGATLLVSNIGQCTAVVLLGNSSVAVTQSTGVAIVPGQQLPLAVGSNTNIAAIAIGGSTTLNLAQGA